MAASTLKSRVLICCGSGGVGKTTVAAATALAFAQAGQRAVVITIDPARRLAEALGVEALSDSPRLIPGKGSGELWAATLEPAEVFDRLVATLAPTTALRESILRNRLYRELSTALAGSRELIALERIFELAMDPRFDVIILDTPPTQHALDFIDAPERVARLLDGSLMRWFSRSAPLTPLSLLRDGSALAFKAIERLTGMQVFADIGVFLKLFAGLFEGFRQRADAVQSLLRGPASAFILVATPSEAALRQARAFEKRLSEEGYAVAALVANRLEWGGEDPLPLPALALTIDDQKLLADLPMVANSEERLRAIHASRVHRYASEQRFLETLGALGLPVIGVPRLSADVGAPADLDALARALRNLVDQP
jgi:anion-transporting  ArsA/GET3 family ATPase